MVDREPKPNNPLAPYYPSEVPSLPASGPKRGAVVLLLVVLGWVALEVVQWLLRLAGPG